jgi:hypothetical protein
LHDLARKAKMNGLFGCKVVIYGLPDLKRPQRGLVAALTELFQPDMHAA